MRIKINLQMKRMMKRAKQKCDNQKNKDQTVIQSFENI